MRDRDPSSVPPVNVLVAEDCPEVRGQLVTLLRLAGHRVEEAEDGQAALAKVRDDLEVLVTDCDMPRLGGEGLASEVGCRMPWVQALFVSGATAPAAAKHFLPKPFTHSAILERVEALARVARTLRARERRERGEGSHA